MALKEVSALSQVSRGLNQGKKRQHISLEYEKDESRPGEQKQGDQDQDGEKAGSTCPEIREDVKKVKCESAGGNIGLDQPIPVGSFNIKVERDDCDARLSNASACTAHSVANLLTGSVVERPGVIVKQEPASSGSAPRVPFVTGEPFMHNTNLPQALSFSSQPFTKVEPYGSIPHIPPNVVGEPFIHGINVSQGLSLPNELFIKAEPNFGSVITHHAPAPYLPTEMKGVVNLEREISASAIDGSSSKKTKPGASRKQAVKAERPSGETSTWEPPLWREQMANIVRMREKRDAPVDLEGAHKNAASLDLVAPEVCTAQGWV